MLLCYRGKSFESTSFDKQIIKNRKRPGEQHLVFSLERKNVKRLKVYAKIVNERIVCLCLRSRRRCNESCKKDEVLYDEFAEWKECSKNIKGWP